MSYIFIKSAIINLFQRIPLSRLCNTINNDNIIHKEFLGKLIRYLQ